MDTPGSRLRKMRGAVSQEELAKTLEISLRTYSGYENDEYLPRVDILLKMCDLWGVTADYILNGRDEESGFSFIPYFKQPASAGYGALVEDTVTGKFLAFRTDWLKGELNVQIKDVYCMRVTGDSMESPTGEYRLRELRHGDLILVDRGFTNLLTNHIYVISVGDDLYVKAFNRPMTNTLQFFSFNPAYTPIVFDEKNMNLLKIEGRVSWVGRTIV